MYISRLELHNFQGIRDLSLALTEHGVKIFGDNATGKTTVYNAYTWLLFDKAATGAKNFSPKTKGPDGDLHHLDHSAEAVLVTDSGRQITLKKTLRESYKKKRGSASEEFSGHTVEYEVDGVPVKEKEFSVLVCDITGGEGEKTKMLTMPDYFPERLSWEARRKILLEICGDIQDDDIIDANDDLKELRSFLRMNSAAEQYYTIDEYKKVAASRRAEINRKLTELPARIDEATQAMPNAVGLNAEEIEANIAILMKKRDALMKEKAQTAAGATAALRERIADLRAQIAEGRAAHFASQSEQDAALDAEAASVSREEAALRREEDELVGKMRKVSREKERLTALREELLEQYQNVSRTEWDEEQEACPTCGRRLPEGDIEKMREEFNLRKSKKLEEINERGKTEASKERIAALEKEYAKLDAELVGVVKEIAAAGEKADALQAKRLPLALYETTDEYAALIAQISDIEAKRADEEKYIGEAVAAVEEKIKAAGEAIKEEQAKQIQLSAAKAQQHRIAELEAQEKSLAAEYETTEKGLYLCDLFTKKKVSALTERINAKFKSVRFRLFVEQINGGLKEDCEVMIPCADGSMVPYAFANNAARINAGLEIIGTLAQHWGVRMPVFIDNAESVTSMADIDSQLIKLIVSEEDKALRVEVEA